MFSIHTRMVVIFVFTLVLSASVGYGEAFARALPDDTAPLADAGQSEDTDMIKIADWQAYEDVALGYTVKIPAGWYVMQGDDQPGSSTYIFNYDPVTGEMVDTGSDDPPIHIAISVAYYDRDPKSPLRDWITLPPEFARSITIDPDRSSDVSDNLILLAYDSAMSRSKRAFIAHGNTVYLVDLAPDDSIWDDVFGEVINSFTVTKEIIRNQPMVNSMYGASYPLFLPMVSNTSKDHAYTVSEQPVKSLGDAAVNEVPSNYRLPFTGKYIITQGASYCTNERWTHKGAYSESIDFSMNPGTQIVASEAGLFVMAWNVSDGWGNTGKIFHSDGRESWYAHIRKNLVPSYTYVEKGQPIALSSGKVGECGNNCNVRGNGHLHFHILSTAKITEYIRKMPGIRWYSGDPDNPCVKGNDGVATGGDIPYIARPDQIHVDGPASGETITGKLIVGGWASDSVYAIDYVKLFLNDSWVGYAKYGINRPDLNSRNVGFRWEIDSTTLGARKYRLRVEVVDKAGNSRSVYRDFTVKDVSSPNPAYIDVPANNATVKGVTTVSGWAEDKGSGIKRIEIWVGSNHVGDATYGIFRKDLNGKVGYTYQLDTTKVGNGPQTLKVKFFDGANNAPRIITRSITVNNTPTWNSSFISQSVPTTMVAGQKYEVSITYKNTGARRWTRALNIKLGSQNPRDNNRWSVRRVLLATTDAISPGQQKTFKFKVTAPSKPGTYDFRWRMMRELVAWFGPLSPNLKIKVIAPPAAPTLTRRGCAATSNVWQNACNDMAFTWSPAVNSSQGVKDYLVYWGKSASGAPNQVVKTAAFNPGPVPSGRTYYLRVRARDSAGNRFATKTLYILRYDNQSPGNPTTIDPGCTVSNDQWQSTCDSPVFTWSGANDAGGSGVSAYRVYWGESATGAPTTPLSKASFTPSTPAQTLQPAYLRIQAIDKAGNVSAAKTLFTLKYEAPPSEYALSIRQGTTTVATSETFSVNVRVQAPGPVDGAAAYIDFDPSLLQVVSLASGGVLDSTLQNSYDNSTGRINFAAGTLNSPLPSGNFTLVTIQFTAQTASPETQLVFATSSPRVSDITANGASVLQQLTGGAVVVMSAGAASSSSGPASSTNRVHLPQIIQSR